MDKYIVGLGGSAHEFSAVVLKNEDIVIGIEDERVTRRKNGASWWYEIPCLPSVNYCMQDIEHSEIDTFVGCDILPNRTKQKFENLVLYNHHLLHAASIYYFCEHEKMAIIVFDGWGSIIDAPINGTQARETISFFSCENGRIDLLGRTTGLQPIENNSFSMGISNSIGYFYNMLTKLIGFGKLEEGKTMGMAGYGGASHLELFKTHISFSQDFNQAFTFDPLNSDFSSKIQTVLMNNGNTFQIRADMAYCGQKIFEEAILTYVHELLDRGFNTIGIAGGCALNSVANGKIYDYLSERNKSFVVLPHVNDAGIALGAAAYHYHKSKRKKIPFTIKGQKEKRKIYSISKHYSENNILEAINMFYPSISYELCAQPERKIAQLINEGYIIAIFYKGSEFGPRALGNRSILSNPTSSLYREKINREIKFREPFRPIAPVIMEDHYCDYFEGSPHRPFMLNVAKVKKDKMDRISSTIHIDKTARVQTVYQKLNPRLYNILQEYYKLSGIPVISNTSFNQKNQPIVETPYDALNAFKKMSIDYLLIENYLIEKINPDDLKKKRR